jgi:hypothetical protein
VGTLDESGADTLSTSASELNQGCTGTDFKVCPMTVGATRYSNGSSALKQVVLKNSTSQAWQINLVAASRTNTANWAEVGLYLCASDGTGCTLDPPGQVIHGLGEVAMMNAQAGQSVFTRRAGTATCRGSRCPPATTCSSTARRWVRAP